MLPEGRHPCRRNSAAASSELGAVRRPLLPKVFRKTVQALKKPPHILPRRLREVGDKLLGRDAHPKQSDEIELKQPETVATGGASPG
jgi:hypothetical protein